uniref:Uncharacterized protein n=1 Tax=viral metagenome TaxID=1070528 RepID=A0A6C0JWJ7_9ZZZZ
MALEQIGERVFKLFVRLLPSMMAITVILIGSYNAVHSLDEQQTLLNVLLTSVGVGMLIYIWYR